MKHLKNCTLHIHRELLQCTDKENPPEKIRNIYQDFKVNPDDFLPDSVEECPWPTHLLTRPCGQIGVEADVRYLFCSWIISIDYRLTINATFMYFNLPRAKINCKLDRLQIEDMDQQKSTSRFCGRREPFSVIPDFSRLRFDLNVDLRITLPERTSGFSMFYQVTAIDKYVMPGRADYENIYTDTLPTYFFSLSNLIMQVKEQSVFSFHFNVDIRFYIHVEFVAVFLEEDTVLQFYDGPSKVCHKLIEFQSLGDNETVTSFGTSLLLLLKTRSFNKELVAVTFTALQRQFHISPILYAENMKNDLAIPLRESKFCYAQHSAVFCNLQIVSDTLDRFIKLENIFVHMKIIHIFDCNFGSFWILDGDFPVWKWCGHKVPFLRQITSATNQLNIKILLYKIHVDELSIALQYSLSPCPAISINNKEILVGNSLIVKLTETDGGSVLVIQKVANKCFVVQSVWDGAKRHHSIHIRGLKKNEVFHLDIIRVSNDEALSCSDIWNVYLTAKFGVNQFGTANFYRSKEIKDNPMWTNVFYHVVHATATYEHNHVCDFDDGFIVTVRDSCDKLTADTKYLINFEIAPNEVQVMIRLYSGCKQFPVDVGKIHPFLLGFDGRMLCKPLMTNGRFPCMSRQGILCESILHCALHLEVQLIQSSHDDCRSAGYYVDITSVEGTVRLR